MRARIDRSPSPRKVAAAKRRRCKERRRSSLIPLTLTALRQAPQKDQGAQGQKEQGAPGQKDQGKQGQSQRGQRERDQSTGQGQPDQSQSPAQSQRDQSPMRQSQSPQRQQGQQGQTGQPPQGRAEQGQSGGGSTVNLTTEQRTRIRETVVVGGNVPRASNVNFAIKVGTVVPTSVRIVEVPAPIIEIYPEWRGHMYFVVGDEIIIVDRNHRIIVVAPVAFALSHIPCRHRRAHLAAGEPFGGFDDGAERVAIVGISGQRLGVQHELAAWGAGTRQRTNRCLERKPRLVRPR
jgi:hypothetical protein